MELQLPRLWTRLGYKVCTIVYTHNVIHTYVYYYYLIYLLSVGPMRDIGEWRDIQ